MDKTKILILGSKGMAGHVIYFYLKNQNKYEIVNLSFKDKLDENSLLVDVTDSVKLKSIILENNPNIIINCVGILIKGANQNPETAILVNSYLPHFLKSIADEIDSKLIHISTDCVFSGKIGNYSENSFRDADDIYGRTKALGEISNNKHLTLRTSIIGPELKNNGEGLLHWLLNSVGEVSGFTNMIWSGITTLELAKAIEFSIINNHTGLLHVTNGIPISKFDLLCLMKETWHKTDLKILPISNKDVDKSLLVSTKVEFNVPSYNIMLSQLFKWMQDNKELYKDNYSYVY